MSTPPVWRQPDGTPVTCKEKLLVLEDNHAELARMLQDAFDDAILIGVDEAAMRSVLIELVEGLVTPKRR